MVSKIYLFFRRRRILFLCLLASADRIALFFGGAVAGRDDTLRALMVIGRERSRSQERERAARGGVEDYWPPLGADGLGPFEE